MAKINIPLVTPYPSHRGCGESKTSKRTDCNCPKMIYARGFKFTWNAAKEQFELLGPAKNTQGFSAFTKDWQTALSRAEQVRDLFDPKEVAKNAILEKAAIAKKREVITIPDAIQQFHAEYGKKVKSQTMKRYETVTNELGPWAEETDRTVMTHLNTEALKEFRKTWKDKVAVSRILKQRMLKTICGFWKDEGYFENNPVEAMGHPGGCKSKPILVFSHEQFLAVIAATESMACSPFSFDDDGARKRTPLFEYKALRLRAMAMLQRFGALAPCDAGALQVTQLSKLKDGKYRITYSRQKLQKKTEAEKTIPPVRVNVPQEVGEILLEAAKLNPNKKYFFWEGNQDPKPGEVTNYWDNQFNHLWPLVVEPTTGKPGLKFQDASHVAVDAKPYMYMFRHTFAVEWLMAGKSTAQLAILMGNSVDIIEKHYMPLVEGFVDAANAELDDVNANLGRSSNADVAYIEQLEAELAAFKKANAMVGSRKGQSAAQAGLHSLRD